MSHADMLQLFDFELRPYRSNDSVCSGRALIAPAKAPARHQVICFAIREKAARGFTCAELADPSPDTPLTSYGSVYILGPSHAEATTCGKYAVAEYPRLEGLLRAVNPRSPNAGFTNKIVPYLVEVWLDDYARTSRKADIVETTVSGFSYLFDVTPGRLIAAWGISEGRHGEPRDKARMRGHPLSAGELYHRGHAIPHTLGGPCDINLVPQLGKINIGPFRELERNAVATPGSLYFTYWTYARNDPADQTPTGVEQGLLISGHSPQITIAPHGN